MTPTPTKLTRVPWTLKSTITVRYIQVGAPCVEGIAAPALNKVSLRKCNIRFQIGLLTSRPYSTPAYWYIQQSERHFSIVM